MECIKANGGIGGSYATLRGLGIVMPACPQAYALGLPSDARFAGFTGADHERFLTTSASGSLRHDKVVP